MKLSKNIVCNICNILMLFIIALVLYFVFDYRYAIACYDDLLDFFILDFRIFHGNFITGPLQKLLIDIIPQYFSINIQNFALFSEGLLKIFCFCLLFHVCSLSFFQFKKQNYFQGVLSAFFFFLITAFILHSRGHFLYKCNDWFLLYIFPASIFLIFLYKHINIFINNSINKKDIILISLLAFLIPTLNEYVGLITLFLLFFTFWKKIPLSVPEEKSSKVVNFAQKIMSYPFLIPLLFCVLMHVLIFCTTSSYADTIGEKMAGEVFNVSAVNNIKDYLYAIYRIILSDNSVYWILLASSMLLVLSEIKEKINKLICIHFFAFILSSVIILAILYFFGDSCNYDNIFEGVRPFWITYFGFWIQYKIIIISYLLYITGFNLYSLTSKRKLIVQYLILAVFFVFSINYIHRDFSFDIGLKADKQAMYQFDKMAVFYFKQGKTAVLPKDNWIGFIAMNTMPDEFWTEGSSDRIYYFDNNDWGKNIYLKYLEKNYHVDISKGVMFKDNEEAYQIYLDNGGEKITEEELEKLDFSVISKEASK